MRKFHKLHFPAGFIIDTKYRVYLSSYVNSIFLAKSHFKRVSEGTNKKLPIKSDEESSLVAGVDEISNFDIIEELAEVIDFLGNFELFV